MVRSIFRIKIHWSMFFFSLSVAANAQDHVFDQPVRLDSNVNSDIEEIRPLPSADGNRLYFTRVFHDGNKGKETGGQDIWFCERRESGEWHVAQNLSLLNNADNNAVVGINRAGNRLYLLNSYSAHARRIRGLSYADLEDGAWKAPEELAIKIYPSSDHYDFYVHQEENVVVISMMDEQSLGMEDLYVAYRKNDQSWSDPVHLGPVINSKGTEIAPFLSQDQKTLYFASDGHEGLGDMDIFASARIDSSWTNWGEPVNLGKPVNSTSFDAYFHIGGDGNAFFASNRDGKFNDIYSTSLLEMTVESDSVVTAEAQLPNEEDIPGKETVLKDEATRGGTIIVAGKITIYFDFDRHEIRADQLERLDSAKALLRTGKTIFVEATGYTDAVGTEVYNQALSLKRAEAVKTYLLSSKPPISKQVKISGKGEAEPAYSNDSKYGRSLNRRVELVIKREN